MFVVVALVAYWFASVKLGLDPTGSWVLAVIAALGWLGFAAVFWPFVPCPAPGCDKGKVRRSGKRVAYRKCWWCGGAGSRLRWFRRFYDHMRPKKRGG